MRRRVFPNCTTVPEQTANCVQSDTGEKPYACGQCFLTFSRVDLRRRHWLAAHCESVQSIEDKESDLEATQHGRKRPRTKVACDSCSQAKVKCGSRRPCVRCLKRNVQCTLSRHRLSSQMSDTSRTFSDLPTAQQVTALQGHYAPGSNEEPSAQRAIGQDGYQAAAGPTSRSTAGYRTPDSIIQTRDTAASDGSSAVQGAHIANAALSSSNMLALPDFDAEPFATRPSGPTAGLFAEPQRVESIYNEMNIVSEISLITQVSISD